MKITKLYSDYDEYYDERLYSTGNDDLDELLECAFCDGYEYAQREFAEEEENEHKKKHTGAKIAAGVGGTAVVGAGDIYGAEQLGKHLVKKGNELIGDVIITEGKDGVLNYKGKDGKFVKKEQRVSAQRGARMKSRGESMQKPMGFVRDKFGKIIKKRAK